MDRISIRSTTVLCYTSSCKRPPQGKGNEMGCFMGGEGTVKIDWSRYNSILCKLGFDGSFRELICSHGFEPTFECESLVGLYLPYEKHPYGTEDLLSDLKPYVEPGSWFRWEYEDGAVEIEDFGNPELLAKAFADNGEVEVANVDPRFVHATLAASKSLGVGIAQPLDESGEVSDPLVFINLIDSGGSWKGTYSELADRLGVGVAE